MFGKRDFDFIGNFLDRDFEDRMGNSRNMDLKLEICQTKVVSILIEGILLHHTTNIK